MTTCTIPEVVDSINRFSCPTISPDGCGGVCWWYTIGLSGKYWKHMRWNEYWIYCRCVYTLCKLIRGSYSGGGGRIWKLNKGCYWEIGGGLLLCIDIGQYCTMNLATLHSHRFEPVSYSSAVGTNPHEPHTSLSCRTFVRSNGLRIHYNIKRIFIIVQYMCVIVWTSKLNLKFAYLCILSAQMSAYMNDKIKW